MMQCFKRNKKQWITFLVVLAVVFAVFLAVSPVYQYYLGFDQIVRQSFEYFGFRHCFIFKIQRFCKFFGRG